MTRRVTSRMRMFSAMSTHERRNGHWRIGRTEGGRSELRNGAFGQCGHDRMAIDAGSLSLVGRHAQRGVAFQMLHRTKPLARSESHILTGHIVLEIDECLRVGCERTDKPQGSQA